MMLSPASMLKGDNAKIIAAISVKNKFLLDFIVSLCLLSLLVLIKTVIAHCTSTVGNNTLIGVFP